MATQTLSRTATQRTDRGPFTHIVLPLLLTLGLLAVIVAAAVVLGVFHAANLREGKQLVLKRLEQPFKVFGWQHEINPAWYLAGLVPVLLAVAGGVLAWLHNRSSSPAAKSRLFLGAILLGAVAAVFGLLGAVFIYGAWVFVRSGEARAGTRAVIVAVLGAVVALFVFVFLVLPGVFAWDLKLEPSWFWWPVALAVVLAAGLVYAGWQYVRDAQTVGIPWAIFLGLLRGAVYVVVALVFLLPALQSFDEATNQSKVVLLWDVSASMLTKDDVPTETMPVEKLPTRMDKLVDYLAGGQSTFLARLQERNPIFGYRFGGQLDEDYLVLDGGLHWWRAEWEERRRLSARGAANKDEAEPFAGRGWQRDDWDAWLRPAVQPEAEEMKEEERPKFRKRMELYQRLLASTNLGDSTLTALNREVNNMVQGIVVFSDGRNTEGSPQAYTDLAERAKKAKVPIFVVAVGQDRPPIRIDITDVPAPEQVRPEDEFPVRVEVNGEGLANREVSVFLDVMDPAGQKVLTLDKKLTFKPGEPPHGNAEFKITPALVSGEQVDDKGAKKRPAFAEGEWKFVARVPKDRREIFIPAEHKSDPVVVRVVKRPVRVLLFAGGASHEYQFLRTLFVRESDKGRAELSVYLQPVPGQAQRRPGIVQDVPPERLLTAFPNQLKGEEETKAEEKYYNLASYDLIIAFDPDWSQLTREQLELVERWVSGTYAGGLVVVAGPVNTYQLARPGAGREKLKPILDLLPVIPEDNRMLNLERSPTEPFRLNFPGANPDLEFLKLDEENPMAPQLAAWEEFFTGQAQSSGNPAAPVIRGMFGYYPVKAAKESAEVIATFADPRARLLESNKEHPYLVTMAYGGGKVVWIGSGEMRRLRAFRETWYERFWTKLARYAGSGNLSSLNKRITPVIGRRFQANTFVPVEAKIEGRDGRPLSQHVRPQIVLKPPAGVRAPDKPIELQPKPGAGAWEGWFAGRFLVKNAGEYGGELRVNETGDSVPIKFTVTEANPEADNTRPDFERLYNLASEADDVLGRVREDVSKQLRTVLQRPVAGQAADKPVEGRAASEGEKPRLYFDLKTADMIPECMVTDRKTTVSRGPVKDLWDMAGPVLPDWARGILGTAVVVLLLVGTGFGIVTGLTAARKQPVGVWLTATLVVLVLLAAAIPLWYLTVNKTDTWGQPEVSFVLIVVVTLLSVEWLTRKMLKLA